MEIEAKFALPNRQTYRDLLRLRALAGFTLIPTAAVHITDRYFDTADSRLLAAGYTCRLRTEGALVLATLKGLGGARGAVHHRDEQEVQLVAWTPEVAVWPASSARDLAQKLTGGMPLQPLFDLEQHRSRADVMDEARRVAELSLDAVRATVGRRPALYYELEVELKPEGTETDLATVVQELRTIYNLTPEPRSKFERALETLQGRGAVAETSLSDAERDALAAYAAGPDPELARRAAVILGWADGLPTREIVASTGLSDGRVRFWVRAFRARRTEIFAQGAPGATDAAEKENVGRHERVASLRGPGRPARRHTAEVVTPDHEQPVRAARKTPARRSRRAGSAVQGQAEPPAPPPPAAETPPLPAVSPPLKRAHALPTVVEFCREQGVDMAHARFVSQQAVALFDLLRAAHRLPRKRRKLLQQAALLCTIGATQDPAHPERAGRDLILAQPLHGVSTGDRLVLACLVALQRRKPKPDKEPALAALEAKQREHIQPLAALLRVAQALDLSRTQASLITSAEGADSARCDLVLTGPAADVDARQAADRADWWQQLVKQTLAFTAITPPAPAEPAQGDGTEAPSPPPEIVVPPIQADEPMSEAGRKAMYTHFLRMLANEAGTRLGQDIEALHDMRVATRRMRAAYSIFADYFDPAVLAPFNKGLRRVGRALGTVRDLDVLMEKAEAYQSTLEEGATEVLAPLLADWRARREVARREMLAHLDSPAYRDFVTAFQVFLTTPGAGAQPVPIGEPLPHQVRHVAPRLILTRYEVVRAYETIIDGAPLPTYHMLRIDCKRLRYALEFFRDVLGREAPEIIKQVTAMQDLLGALQDAHVAEDLIAGFLEEQRKKRKKGLPEEVLAGVAGYLAAQQATQQDLLGLFPAPWAELVGYDFRRALALAVAAL